VDNTNYSPEMLEAVVASGALDTDPFVLVDVGCGLGLDPAWRLFGRLLHAHGFDPQVQECERLAGLEKNANVHYHAALVGLPADHPVIVRRRAETDLYFDPFGRSSATAGAAGELPFAETNDWRALELATETVGLAEFLRDRGVEQVDFVKVDTDGSDLDVLLSFEEAMEPSRVLGFMVETPFPGSASDTANSFHNIDGLLKRHGFLLYNLTVNRYTRSALPGRFVYRMMAQTTSGQPMWGDLIYLRDAVGPGWARFGELSPAKLLKLACLYELFQVPDCAAELLVARRAELAGLVDVDRMLDLLTPPLDGRRVGYREYVETFAEDPASFYPPDPASEAPESAVRRWLSRR
jgi:FkbM family methyltransferase